MAAAREAAIAHNARKADPRSIHDYRAWNTMRLVCALTVRTSRPFPASIECMRGTERFYLPKSKIIEQPESTGEFALVCLPKWLAGKTGLMATTPELAGEWTDEQRQIWERLTRLRSAINSNIYYAKRRPSAISRGNAA